MKTIFVFLVVTFCFVVNAFSETIEAEGRYWITDLSASASVTANDITGSDLDLEDDLGVGDEDYPEVRLTWHTGPNSRIRFAYTQAGYSGEKNIEQTFTFDGQTYTVGTSVNTDFDVKYFRLGWIWQFLNLAEDKIKLGSLIDVKGLMIDASLDAPALSISESESFAGGLPTIGAVVDINPIEKINLFAEISGIPAGDIGYFFDAEFGVKFMPTENFSVSAGYRIFDMKFENDPDYAELRLSGPFVGGSFRF